MPIDSGKDPLRRLWLSAVVLMSVLSGILALLLLVTELQGTLDRRRQSYEALLDTFTSIYIQEQLGRDGALLDALSAQLKLTEERPLALSSTWPLLVRTLKAGGEHAYFYNTHSELIEAYPNWEKPLGFVATKRPWAILLNPDIKKETIWVGPYLEFSSQKPMMTVVRRVRNVDGALRGLLMVDLALEPVKQAIGRAIKSTPTTLIIFNREGQIVVDANPRGIPVDANILRKADFSGSLFKSLKNGMGIHRHIKSPDWDIVLYLPANELHKQILTTAPRYILALFGLLSLWLAGLLMLKRLFMQEQRFLLKTMTALERQKEGKYIQPRHKSTWFFDEQWKIVRHIAKKLNDANRASQEDILTGLDNRRAFDSDFITRWDSGSEFWLLAIDIDHFKKINDRYGHLVGDTVLQRLATALNYDRNCLRVYRTGGDEMLAIANEQMEIEALLSRLLENVTTLRWREHELAVSVSIGAVARSEATDAKGMLQMADDRLYHCKQTGRGRACWYDPAVGLE
ncbi:diguanylate cyclase [Craterilacuibacter sp. RT1T]|uniref:sensor domain-containing diguanylate cyclase n=1 Tax=Craterilacuibacter sp. RT1T TaxID=2942211 RepID=UPI0020BF6CA2|nr:diguanylate cyclase [Craterilacuibacter sp. RT1T]MCL6264470.1 diguanylate cyclase [Craterilacuibacter sp. RT1T]